MCSYFVSVKLSTYTYYITFLNEDITSVSVVFVLPLSLFFCLSFVSRSDDRFSHKIHYSLEKSLIVVFLKCRDLNDLIIAIATVK